jgi:hypothetical protein
MTTQEQNQIATTILQQLGGRKFQAMTGSRDFIATGSGLRMDLAKNHSGANRLEINLEADDTYTVHFYRITMTKNFDCIVTTKAKESGLYSEMLQEFFTKVTGLDTGL